MAKKSLQSLENLNNNYYWNQYPRKHKDGYLGDIVAKNPWILSNGRGLVTFKNANLIGISIRTCICILKINFSKILSQSFMMKYPVYYSLLLYLFLENMKQMNASSVSLWQRFKASFNK